MRSVVKVDEHAGRRAGDPVRVKGEQGRFHVKSFALRDGECVWVDLWGGTQGREMARAVSPDRVRRAKKRRN